MARIRPSDYVEGDRILIGKLGRLIFGAIIGAVGTSVASLFLAGWDLVLTPVQVATDIWARLVAAWYGIGLAAVAGSWSEAAAFVSTLGPAGIVVSVVIVLGVMWVFLKIVRWGIAYV